MSAQSVKIDASNKTVKINIVNKIDTSNQKIKNLYLFINDYMNQDTISNEYWNPKYKTISKYNYNSFIDWIWRSKSPAWIKQHFSIKLVELDTLSDTLAYFKLFLYSNSDTINVIPNYNNVYKYYINKINGKYYLDNCKEYETRNFISYKTKNIYFHLSPLLIIDTLQMIKASNQLDDLCKSLNRKPPDSPFNYYMCSSENEMNIICNIVMWDGRQGGFTDTEEKFVVSITKNVFYQHEFIHILLGKGAPCFFLSEGIATLYGGPSQFTTYQEGLNQLKECYQTGKCNFDNLYDRKISNAQNSNPTYIFAAAFCQYLIETLGLKKFYELYYDKDITTLNFLEKVKEYTHKTKEEIKTGIEKIILNN